MSRDTAPQPPPGTPDAILTALADFARDKCGHDPLSSRHPLTSVMARIAALEIQLAEAQSGETAQTITGALVEKRDRYIRQLEEKIARQREDLRAKVVRIAALEAELAEAKKYIEQLEKTDL